MHIYRGQDPMPSYSALLATLPGEVVPHIAARRV